MLEYNWGSTIASRMYTTNTAKARLRRMDAKRSIPFFRGQLTQSPFSHSCKNS